MQIIELSTYNLVEGFVNDDPFTYSVQPARWTAADYWVNNFGANDDSRVNVITITGFTRDNTVFYTDAGSAAACRATEKSFYWDQQEQVLYVHFEHEYAPGTSEYEYATFWGFSEDQPIDIDSDPYDPLLLSVPSLAQQQDLINYDLFSYVDGSFLLTNTQGLLDFLIDENIYGNEVRHYYINPDDIISDANGKLSAARSALKALSSFYVEDYLITCKEFDLRVQDKRKADNTIIPTNKFNRTDYPDLEDNYLDTVVPLGYGDLREVNCTPVDGNNTGSSVNFRAMEILTVLGTPQVSINGEFVSKTALSTSLSTGSFELANSQIESSVDVQNNGEGKVRLYKAGVYTDLEALENIYVDFSNNDLYTDKFYEIIDSSTDYIDIDVDYLGEFPPDDDLLLWYSFDETDGSTAADSGPNRDDLTLSTGRFQGGIVNKSQRFESASLESGFNSSITRESGDSFTISAWFRLESINTFQTIAMIGSGGTIDIELKVTSGNIIRAQFIDFPGGGSNTLESTTTVVADEWYHVVYTYNGTDAYLYLGNDKTVTLEDSDTFSASIRNTGTYIYVASSLAASEYLNGRIDELRFYDQYLTAENAYGLFYQKIPPQNPDPSGVAAEVTIYNGCREPSGAVRVVKLIDPSGIYNNQTSEIIVDLNERFLGYEFTSVFYDLTEWGNEESSLTPGALLINSEVELTSVIQQIQAGSNVGFRYEINAEGLRTIRIDDESRSKSFNVDNVEIYNNQDLPIETDSALVFGEILVNYDKSNVNENYLRVVDDTYKEDVKNNYRQLSRIIVDTILSEQNHAEFRAAFDAERFKVIPRIATIEVAALQENRDTFLQSRIFDIIDVELTPAAFVDRDSGEIIGRQYFGIKRCKVIGIEPIEKENKMILVLKILSDVEISGTSSDSEFVYGVGVYGG